MVSIIIAANNEEKHIVQRVHNLLKQNYPSKAMEIIVVSDGSTDSTNDLIEDLIHGQKSMNPDLKLISYTPRKGKAHALNLGFQSAKGEFLVFTDARQQFDSDATRQLIANFNDPEVGCVGGDLLLARKTASDVHESLGMYWGYEKWIRRKESKIDSSIGVAGAIYAIRKDLYEPIPPGTILDDVFIPMSIALKGYRVIVDETAIAYDSMITQSEMEFRRKVRTLMGNFQILTLLPELLSLKKNRLMVNFVTHKLLRLIVPYFLIIIFTLNLFMLDGIYYTFFLAQMFFYFLSLVGFILTYHKISIKLFSIPYTFVLFNCAAVYGFINFVRKNDRIWMPSSSYEKKY
jgi:cellulose synthase/poly-beta-1,6-N-acetylglucosamine synthase-like glycosyltransferase